MAETIPDEVYEGHGFLKLMGGLSMWWAVVYDSGLRGDKGLKVDAGGIVWFSKCLKNCAGAEGP